MTSPLDTLESELSTLVQYNLSDQVTVGQLQRVGGYSDIYGGVLRDQEGVKADVHVAIKLFRYIARHNSKSVKVCPHSLVDHFFLVDKYLYNALEGRCRRVTVMD